MKILYFGDCSPGAMGIIHRDIKKIIDAKYPEIQFDLLDWAHTNSYVEFFNNKLWKSYDIIITDPQIATIADGGWLFEKEDQESFKSKLIPVYHHEVDVPTESGFNHGWYEGWFRTPLCSINPYIVDQIKARGVDSQLLPIGVSREKFKPFKEVKKIKKAGFIGNAFHESAGWGSIKRPELFKNICDIASIACVPIFGKENNLEMYKDIDVIICTSTAEGNPMGLLEATACKIPFISTNVGIVRYYDKVKTFETANEAVAIINELNQSTENIPKYVDELHNQLFPHRDWASILADYWIPYFKKINL